MEKGSRKRSSVSGDFVHDHVKGVVVEFADVLAAYGPIKDKLHDYVKNNVEDYLKENFEKEEVVKFIEDFRKEVGDDLAPIPSEGKDEILKAVTDNVLVILNKPCDHHHKLESINTMLIKQAVECEEIKMELFDDVANSLKQWTDKKVKVVVLAPCPVDIFKLLLSSSGISQDEVVVESLGEEPHAVKETYVKLANKLQMAPADILFITVSHNEAVASSAAGFLVLLFKRTEGGGDVGGDNDTNFRTVHNLKDVFKIPHADIVPHKISRGDGHEEVAKS